MVELPNDKEDLAFDAITLHIARDSFYIKTVREGKTNFRKYEPLRKTSNYNEFCIVAYLTSEDEQ